MDCYGDANVGCPFFNRKEAHKIKCEGPFYKTTVNTLYFENNDQRDAVMRLHCNRGYQTCPLYRAAYSKYLDPKK